MRSTHKYPTYQTATPPATPIRLHPPFDGCVLGEVPLGGRRITHGTDAMMEGVLCEQGRDPEEARVFVARTSTVVTPRVAGLSRLRASLHSGARRIARNSE